MLGRSTGTPFSTAQFQDGPPKQVADELREAAMKKASEDLLQILFQEGKYSEDDQASLRALCKANVLEECAVSVKKRMRERPTEGFQKSSRVSTMPRDRFLSSSPPRS